MNVEQYQEALACAVSFFHWPARYVPDLDWINRALAANTEPIQYQDGFEFVFLSGWHECAWYYAWLDARESGATAAEQEALDVMTTVLPNHDRVIPNFPGEMDPSVANHRRRIAAQAALGDPTLVLDWVAHNCSFTVWEPGS